MPSHSRGKIVEFGFLQWDLATEVQSYDQYIQYVGHICWACSNDPIIWVLYIPVKNNASVRIKSRVKLTFVGDGGGVAVSTQSGFYSLKLFLRHCCYKQGRSHAVQTTCHYFFSTPLVFLFLLHVVLLHECCFYSMHQQCYRVRVSFPSHTVCRQSRELAGWASNMRMWQ